MDFEHGDVKFHAFISRKDFENMCVHLFKKCADSIQYALIDAQLSKNEIEEVLLIGGSTRIPKIKELIEIYFSGQTVRYIENSDLAVAIGASIQAALLAGQIEI